jgi:uncharacterized repeat protein (TIGR03803 family)
MEKSFMQHDRRSSSTFWRVALAVLVVIAGFASKTYGQTSYQVVAAFTFPNGVSPVAELIQASDGSFYGTTLYGGAEGLGRPEGLGTIFKIDAAGTLITLHRFNGSDGVFPYAGLIQGRDGSFYGTTQSTIFKIDATGTLTTLHSFNNWYDGVLLYAGLIQGRDGSFYGTTASGGSAAAGGNGTIFKIDAAGTLTTLYSFKYGDEGGSPLAELLQASDGSLYGTTIVGGASDYGTIFKIDAAGTLTTLHGFNYSDGAFPNAGLIQGRDGDFYGTTKAGGAAGYGTIFKIHATGTLTTLHSFNWNDGADLYGGLIQASDGSFYGTTSYGGAAGYGTIFKIDTAGTLTTLHSFNLSDGAYPQAGLIQASDGSFYGTASRGGPADAGVVFRLTVESIANGSIDGRVINDTNGNGVLDVGEGFLRDPVLECTGTAVSGLIISWSGPTSGSTSVNLCSSGGPYYHVGNLPAGTYNLTLSVPGGWQPVTAATVSVVVSSSGTAQTSFFIRPVANGAIDGRVINDTNGNGVLDVGEGFLRDRALECTGTKVSGLLISWNGPTSGSTSVNLCNSGGPYFHIGNLVAGTYNVTLSVPSGWQAINASTMSVQVTDEGIAQASFMVQSSGTYSNVLFLPGLEASRLYTQGLISENKLWLPNRTNDVCLLQPARDGSSRLPIYTRDIIDSAFGWVDIYSSFITFMDDLRSQRFLTDWMAFPYDWRMDVDDIARNGTALQSSTASLIASVDALATSSATGKVTVVTHSNGGLLAKQLVSALVAQGKADKVDRIVMIAAPQLGTPQAIAELLHGDNELVDPATWREAGETMIGALNLLPSEQYFSRVGWPVISFDPQAPGSQLATFRQIYGNSISNYGSDSTGFRGFVLGADSRPEAFKGTCTNAYGGDTSQPNVLQGTLLDRVQTLHAQEDGWQPPSGVHLFQVAGSGLPTLKGITYTSRQVCGVYSCTYNLDHEPTTTVSGDGTVVVPSATYLPAETFYFDLNDYNWQSGSNLAHKDIMAALPVQELIFQLLAGHDNPSITDISKSQPIGARYMRLTLYSPVTVHAYDSSGRHTGLIQNPDPQSQLPAFEALIPNSRFELFSNHVNLTLGSDDQYHIVLQGLATGTFTLALEEFIDDQLAQKRLYTDIPVTNTTTADLFLSDVASAGALQLDIQGDGVADFTVASAAQPNASQSLEILTAVIRSLQLDNGIRVRLSSMIHAAAADVQRGDRIAARNVLAAFKHAVQAQSGKLIPAELASSLIVIANTVLESI